MSTSLPQEDDDETLRNLRGRLQALHSGRPSDTLVTALIVIYLVVIFVRPQDLSGLSFLGTIRFPVVINTCVGLLWLIRFRDSWSFQTKLIAGFLAVEAARGLLGYWLGDLVRNDFWQLQTWKNLCLQASGLVFPIVVFMSYGSRIRLLGGAIACIGGFLGFYALTHAGTGPGGFVQDENDLCLVLLLCLPFASAMVSSKRGLSKQAGWLGLVLLMLGGVVASRSRGGFLGLAAVLLCLFLESKRKGALIFMSVLVALASLPFVPTDYWSEIGSIQTDASDGTGTIQKRIDTWKVAVDLWLSPRNFLFGTGLENSRFWLEDFEGVEFGVTRRSLAGRAVHSLYFQLIADLGFYGLILFVTLVGSCVLGNKRDYRGMQRYIRILQKNLSTQKQKRAELGEDEEFSNAEEVPLEDQSAVEQLRALAPFALREAEIHERFSKAANIAWAGVLVAGVGISVLYYPPIWFLIAYSTALQRYSSRVRQSLRHYFETIDSGDSTSETTTS